ncbi:MAG: di-trans,poly-cis-decaprenylcistransferase [Pseudomonadota bacterium]|jgi:undecaprenyl diphosphate synthase
MAFFTSGAAPKPTQLPAHVAVIMDGNGRWAKKRFLPRLAGHRQGVETLRRIVQWSLDRGIKVLSVFAFSSENWNRPPDEVSGLMDLLGRVLVKEVPDLHGRGVRVCFPGDRSVLSPKVAEAMAGVQAVVPADQRMTLNVCFNYGGRWDIAQAAKKVIALGQEINECNLAAQLALAHVPDPDLLIRTGGEQRISNFMLWQLAYAELFFSEQLWPDFDQTEFDRALTLFASRERRFGKTSEQLQTLAVTPS